MSVKHLNQRQLADRWAVSEASLERWRSAGKDTGVVHFDDGRVRVSADLPKRVDWDQSILAVIVERMTEAGDDPTEYVDIGYRVSETKFNAWPEGIKRAFVAARTLKTGKPSFRLALLEE